MRESQDYSLAGQKWVLLSLRLGRMYVPRSLYRGEAFVVYKKSILSYSSKKAPSVFGGDSGE